MHSFSLYHTSNSLQVMDFFYLTFYRIKSYYAFTFSGEHTFHMSPSFLPLPCVFSSVLRNTIKTLHKSLMNVSFRLQTTSNLLEIQCSKQIYSDCCRNYRCVKYSTASNTKGNYCLKVANHYSAFVSIFSRGFCLNI